MSNSPHRLPMTFGRKPRRDLFVKEYLHDLNATQAAIRAGYSRKTAKQQGARLLTNVDLQAAIQDAMDRRASRLEITADQVLKELALIGFSNMLDYIKVQGDGTAYVDLTELDRDKSAAIQEVTVDEYVEGSGKDARTVKRVRFKLADKGTSLELMGKHLKLFTDKVEVGGEFGLIVERLQAARRRMAKYTGAAETRDPSARSGP